jgi:hypothetical protein
MTTKYDNHWLTDLFYKRAVCLESVKHTKTEIADIEAEIRDRLTIKLDEEREKSGRDDGTFYIDTDAGLVKVTAGKTVKWDSQKLRAAAAQLTKEQNEAVFDVTLKIPEKVWDKIGREITVPDDALTAIREARTVKVADPKFEIVADESS